jgi:hypothetical protein
MYDEKISCYPSEKYYHQAAVVWLEMTTSDYFVFPVVFVVVLSQSDFG